MNDTENYLVERVCEIILDTDPNEVNAYAVLRSVARELDCFVPDAHDISKFCAKSWTCGECPLGGRCFEQLDDERNLRIIIDEMNGN